MRQCMDADNLHRRLKKIIGQVQAIDRMVEEDIPCEDILSQINAAKSALHRVGQIVLEGHINHCVRDGIEHGDADKTIENFTQAVERFANMTGKFRERRFGAQSNSYGVLFSFCLVACGAALRKSRERFLDFGRSLLFIFSYSES